MPLSRRPLKRSPRSYPRICRFYARICGTISRMRDRYARRSRRTSCRSDIIPRMSDAYASICGGIPRRKAAHCRVGAKNRRIAGSRTEGGNLMPVPAFLFAGLQRTPCGNRSPLRGFALMSRVCTKSFSRMSRVCEANSVARRRCTAVSSRSSTVPREGERETRTFSYRRTLSARQRLAYVIYRRNWCSAATATGNRILSKSLSGMSSRTVPAAAASSAVRLTPVAANTDIKIAAKQAVLPATVF